jgi:hypothetical protein
VCVSNNTMNLSLFDGYLFSLCVRTSSGGCHQNNNTTTTDVPSGVLILWSHKTCIRHWSRIRRVLCVREWTTWYHCFVCDLFFFICCSHCCIVVVVMMTTPIFFEERGQESKTTHTHRKTKRRRRTIHKSQNRSLWRRK